MKGGTAAKGYTIVEVMIFLAVSGLLFLIAMFTVGNQQSKAEFAQGVRDFQASIDDTVNDIRNGNYPDSAYTCTVTGANAPAPTFASGGAGQGSNSDCTFAGKVLQFRDNDNTAYVYTAAARRLDQSTKIEVSNFTEAKIGVPDSSQLGVYFETFRIQNGIRVRNIYYKKGGPSTAVHAIGFFSSLTNHNLDAQLDNDNATIVIPITNISSTDTEGQARDHINANSANFDANKNPDAVVFCLRQGSNGKRAAVIVGANGNHTATELHIDDVDSAVSGVLGGGTICP